MNLLPIDENSAEGWHKHPLWCIPSKDSGKPVSMRGADICTFSDKEKQMLVSITFADFGIASFHSISFADYKRNKAVSVRSFKRPSTKASRLSDSAVSDCSLTYYDNDLTISILKRKEHRHILMTAPELMLPSGEQGFKADITLTEIPGDESLSALIRNKEKGYIYTTRYIPLSVSGTVFIGDRIEKLSKNSTAGFTWTRSKGLGTSGKASATPVKASIPMAIWPSAPMFMIPDRYATDIPRAIMHSGIALIRTSVMWSLFVRGSMQIV